MSLYVIGIGGTGAKCLEAITNLSATGLLIKPGQPEQTVNLLFIDADETNGSLERARNSLNLYQQNHSLLSSNRAPVPWMQTQIKSLNLWSPFSRTSTDKKLGNFFGYNTLKQNTPPLGNLFDVLFTESEREVALDVGFRGRPAIGSAVMSQIDLQRLDEEPWRTLIERIQGDAGGGLAPKVILYGSMFGGTGASGLPTLGRLLANKLARTGLKDRVKIACVFLLPYFGFTPPVRGTEEVYARADQFLLNTEAALRYYLTQAERVFDTVYLLGNQSLSQVEFSVGKQSQRNKPHFVELFAALAARHFSLNALNETSPIFLISRQQQGRLNWRDLPETMQVKEGLGNAARFAYVWLANIAPELARAKSVGINRFQREAPWFIRFFQPNTGTIERMMGLGGDQMADFNDAKEQAAIVTISDWCKDYLRWLADFHQCEGEEVMLFKESLLTKPTGEQIIPDELSQIILGMEQDRAKQANDTISKLRTNLDRTPPLGKGTIGLAQTLYALCKP